MKQIYVDCSTGIATDMFAAALIGLFDDREQILSQLRLYMPQNISLTLDCANNRGIDGYKLTIKDMLWQPDEDGTNHTHGHSYEQVRTTINASAAPDSAKQTALAIYEIIAAAECKVHGEDIHHIHFHEVGQPRAIAGILAVGALVDMLSPCKFIFSPINTGYGKTECAHGTVDVPAPATAEIIKGLSVYHTPDIQGELCTPSGAAIAKTLASSFCEIMPADFCTHSVGIGGKDFGAVGGLTCYLLD